ncbi:MAG TPA: UrcA family protein [Rhizorhapis sp.]|nr:UrcA family protein [Rhizorhapis sp.]
MNRTFALAAIAGCLSITPAAAQSSGQVIHRETVSFADLDLGSAEGIRALDRRLHAAVRAACGRASPADLAGRNDVRRCRARAMHNVALQRSQVLAAADGTKSAQIAVR